MVKKKKARIASEECEFVRTRPCLDCRGDGFYFRLPAGVSPFASKIENTAKQMRRIQCHCSVGQIITEPGGKQVPENPVSGKVRSLREGDVLAIQALAERFWRVRPREIQDLGITRQEFYERKITELFDSMRNS